MVDTGRIAGAAREIGGRGQGALGQGALDGFRRASAQGRLREVGGRAGTLYDQARGAAQGGAQAAARDVAAFAEDISEQAGPRPRGAPAVRDGNHALVRQVEASPISALLIAGFVGYGLALLVHGRR